jgi:hypothetical protein
MAWLDITGCGMSDYPARSGTYEVKSPAWRSSVSGKLLSATGHEHDAGAEVIVYKNGKPVCNSAQIYGRRPQWIGGMDGMKMSHISDTGSCVDFGEVKVGDTLQIGAKYNTTAHPLDKRMSGLGNAPIMGICQVSNIWELNDRSRNLFYAGLSRIAPLDNEIHLICMSTYS